MATRSERGYLAQPQRWYPGARLSSQGETPFDAYRSVNEQVRQVAAGFDVAHDEPWEFLCECGQPNCTEHVQLRLSEFDAVVGFG
jgi:hypothetical protein